MNLINPNVLRSFLFCPAIKDGFYHKLLELKGLDKPDVIIFDLEDSVHESKKDEARKNLIQHLVVDLENRQKLFGKFKVMVRINKYGTKWFNDDLKAIKQIRPDIVRLAKVESGKEIEIVRRATKLQIGACVESLLGFAKIEEIFRALKRGDIFNLGYEDLSAELMMERPERLDVPNPLTTIIMRCLVLARQYQITMIDSVNRKFKSKQNLAILERECKYTKSMGLTGKTAIHPSQLRTINKTFNQNSQIKLAKESLKQFGNLADGTFVIVNNKFEMKDTPSFKMYGRLLSAFGQTA